MRAPKNIRGHETIMKICQITGVKAQVGHKVSHSNKKVLRRYEPNLKTKRIWSEVEGRWITLRLTAAAMRTINKNGLQATLKEAKALPKIY
ncbi:LSU ribosomal protein L28p [Mucinivorans hirudinis]|uniref:Large ribosomal subunit protein bL28 n=1 Tax=Mucinivorans hirudinis TaxID=1433126 RepID=A0A060R6X2_9BACT|nr:LSU ribosomal protein L28p [Mucinivorans hirudinis]